MNLTKIILLPTVIVFVLLGVGCNKLTKVPQKKQATSSPKVIEKTATTTLTIYESYDCEKTKAKTIDVPKTKAVALAVLEALKMTKEKSMASYLNKPILIKDGIAYLDWKKSNEYANISTSCGSAEFNSQINKSLTQFPTITKVIHSIEGDYQAFYDFMQVGVCPDEVKKYCSKNTQQNDNTKLNKVSKITYFVSEENTNKFCNGSDMDSSGYKNTINILKTTSTLRDTSIMGELVKATIEISTTGMCNTIMKELSYSIKDNTVTIPEISGWAGKNIVMCSCKPLIEVNLLGISGIDKIVWK